VSSLVILDDCYPHPISAFRTLEYGRYLDEFPDATVWTTGVSLPALDEWRPVEAVLAEHGERHPALRGRVRHYDAARDAAAIRDHPAVLMFVGNWWQFRHALQHTRAPFVFTLYPGGNFKRDEPDSDDALREIGAHPHLHRLIVTQRATLDYVLDRGLVDAARVEFVYGGVFPNHNLAAAPPRRRFGFEKDSLDLAFVAARYMPGGLDKGYDLLLDAARLLADVVPGLRVQVVGPWTAADGDLTGLEDRVTFHGWMHSDAFPGFYSAVDAVLAPTRAGVLLPGAFDGFPTGACIEAALGGSAVFCTDPLSQNVVFEDGEELVVVEPDAEAIAATLTRYARDAAALARLGERGRAAFAEVFDLEAQMAPRLRAVRAAVAAASAVA
jgi:glycosyltransferase involved in cell wall biosynthesis